jgi:hypothetical protein
MTRKARPLTCDGAFYMVGPHCFCVFCTCAFHGGREPDSWHSLAPSIAENKKGHYQKTVAFFIFGGVGGVDIKLYTIDIYAITLVQLFSMLLVMLLIFST